ncbi:TonB family protein [Sphingomonas sp. HITSZ_GF]|uniref:TonB family protein n=1 Tax=Sphingomonas sp. HITSZ_GF TaxID=3037247 RepID=UPI00240D9FA5|nr:TonB family protein [Sphingomonas sp. HITSZ_GF]MDG2532908.1 TonB family protein [Sphingomonas sp. HITSZ_GF]
MLTLRSLLFFGTAALAVLAHPAAAQSFASSPAQWISTQDYPAEALAKREEGVVNLAFKIGADGAVQDCKVLYSDASARLRNLSCALIVARGAYRPAHDETGTAVAGEDQLLVRWRAQPAMVMVESQFGGALPRSSPPQWMTDRDYSLVTQGRGDVEVDMRFTIGTDGRIASCTASQGATGQRTCALLKARARFAQPRGERGEPLPTEGHLVMHWRRG